MSQFMIQEQKKNEYYSNKLPTLYHRIIVKGVKTGINIVYYFKST